MPARICWLGLKDRARVGLAFNEMVAKGELKAPIVIGRDHLDSGSVASPNRETEGMRDGSDAVSDWPLLNALLNTASGATWVSFHHGGGVGMGFSQHAGVVIVCDGTPAAAKRIARVLRNDPGTGVMRHADAGYDTRLAAPARTAWICRCSTNDRAFGESSGVTRRGFEPLQREPKSLVLPLHYRVMAGFYSSAGRGRSSPAIASVIQSSRLGELLTSACWMRNASCSSWIVKSTVTSRTLAEAAGYHRSEVQNAPYAACREHIGNALGHIARNSNDS